MHDVVNGDLEFRLDLNQQWGVQDAVWVGVHLGDDGVYLQYLEQQIRIDSGGSFKRMPDRLDT